MQGKNGISNHYGLESDEFQNNSSSNTTFLKNRMKLCSFAVCLLWASSLKTSSFLAMHALKVPLLDSVYNICKSTVQITIEEEDLFSQCADSQLQQCKDNLSNAITFESKRVDRLSMLNSKIVDDLETASNNCNKEGSLLHNALMEWQAHSHSIPINVNGMCSEEDQETMMSTVYDVDVIKSEALAISKEYNEEGANTLSHLVTYIKDRVEYDRNYVKKYMGNFELEVQRYIQITPMPTLDIFHKFHDISLDIEQLFDCSTLLDIQNLTCDDFFPEIAIGGHLKLHADTMFNKWIALGNYWRDSHETMVQNAREFFNKAKEAEATFLYYWNNATYFWNYEISDFRKEIVSWILNCNQCVGRTLGDAYDAIKKVDISVVKLSPSFPINMQFTQEFEEKLQQMFHAIYLDMNWRVIENFEYLKHEWTLPLQKSEEILQDIETKLKKIKTSLGEDLSIIPHDYDPPVYNGTASNINDIDEEVEHYKETSLLFMRRSEETLNLTANPINTSDIIQSNNEGFRYKTNLTGMASKLRDFDISFEKLVSPQINFDIWFFRFTSITDLLYYFDYSIRAFLTLRLCYKYWKVSEVRVPTIDIRYQKPILNPFKMTNGRLLILFFTNPMIGAVILSFMALATAGTIVSIYVPLYREYKVGCVNDIATSNGSFIGHNLYSSSYNFALRKGRSFIVKETNFIDVQKSNTCYQMYKDSVAKLNEQIEEFNTQSQIIENVANHVRVIEQCVDSELLDAQFRIACCNQSGYDSCLQDVRHENNYSCPLNYNVAPVEPYLPPGTLISKKFCDLKINKKWQMEKNAIFNCSFLPECDITCPGPNKQKLRQITKECSCALEWFFHSHLLHGILSLLIFVLLNISRSLLVNGISRVFWRKLHPGIFTVVATCNQDGLLVAKNAKTIEERSQNLHNNITHSYSQSLVDDSCSLAKASTWRKNYIVKKEIDRNSFILQMTGLVLILGAFLLNVIWIILIFQAPDATEVAWLLVN